MSVVLGLFMLQAAAKDDPNSVIVAIISGFASVVVGGLTLLGVYITVRSSRRAKAKTAAIEAADARKTVEAEASAARTADWGAFTDKIQSESDKREKAWLERFEAQDKKIENLGKQVDEAVRGREAAERNATASERRAVAAELRADAAERRADAAEQRASLSEHMQQLLLQALRTIVEWGRERRSKVPMPDLSPEIEQALQTPL